MRDVINPAAINQRSWIWLFINILIPTIGVLLFRWNLFGLLYIFWAELFFLGVFGLLRMLFSCGDHLIVRLGFSLFFVVLYIALLMIVISFSLTSLDFDLLFNFNSTKNVANVGLDLSVIVLFVSFTVEFLIDFMFSGKYKTQLSLIEAFKTFAFTLPLACVILFGIMPISEKIPNAFTNTFLILAILVAKAILDFTIKKSGQYFEKRNEADNITI